ncbi:efflux RND transporter periplasmic adaptor subunit [Acinetobacter sp. C_4_1]|uniref:efflux RND transporter periplasmic adaptor subunit n=1 Tax=unclassified Acinetobacter TaxID=196816 RepID=UPI0021B715E7|nr:MULTISPECIES: efflux RND transporter periplasmic adaptor subunit [unclassified Acinetobacter]MCT8089058.1 efflux RND transporter periplasmic adaptor subunit [Acinetobacter sp. F_3_1]MCT8097213.1 efflux RND transporter periplasmic adaptor subunit [Acinetobacter sp. C_3_1]MCT8100088.1 efflux RND transporter periplasmic adaptor subunit [Acinetobacter sp. C_4_1]MCT8133279.1 efflux RND transporter periplasmic adaptor subunit [Acinetobacter sp. T_3_1]
MKYTLLLLAGISCPIFANTVNFACMVQPAQIVEIRSPVTGTLQQLHVKAGSPIKKGQVLAQIEANVEKSATQTAYYRTQVKGNLATAQAKITHAAKKAERMKQLSAENFVSKQAYDDAMNELNQARAELQVAKENLKQAEFEYKQSQADLNRRKIYSPFNGVVMQQYIYAGSMVGPTEGKNPILKIAQTDLFKINAIIPLKYFRSIKKGQVVKIVPEAPFDKLIATVKLDHVDQVIDASSGTFSAGATIKSNSVKFPSGIRCKMYL